MRSARRRHGRCARSTLSDVSRAHVATVSTADAGCQPRGSAPTRDRSIERRRFHAPREQLGAGFERPEPSRMARLPRVAIACQAHHLVQRGVAGAPTFLDDDDRRLYMSALAEASRASDVAVHAYVLMGDHIHLVATPKTSGGLGEFMQRVGRRYVGGFNQRHARTGALWTGRFQAAVVDPDCFLLSVIAHIELNPVRHGLVASPEAWPWSSAAHHLGLRADPLIVDPAPYWKLGNTPFERESAYRRLLEYPLPPAETQALRRATRSGRAYGSLAFAESLAQSSHRALVPARRGRPLISRARKPVPN